MCSKYQKDLPESLVLLSFSWPTNELTVKNQALARQRGILQCFLVEFFNRILMLPEVQQFSTSAP